MSEYTDLLEKMNYDWETEKHLIETGVIPKKIKKCPICKQSDQLQFIQPDDLILISIIYGFEWYCPNCHVYLSSDKHVYEYRPNTPFGSYHKMKKTKTGYVSCLRK